MKIKGMIVQKIPPEKHKRYFRPESNVPGDKTILTVRKPETPNSRIKRFVESIRRNIKSLSGEVEDFYWNVAVDSCPERIGDEIELETEPHMVESGLLLGSRC